MGKSYSVPATVTFLWMSSVSFFFSIKENRKSVGLLTCPGAVSRVRSVAPGGTNPAVGADLLPVFIKQFPAYLSNGWIFSRIQQVIFINLLKIR